MPVRQWEHIYLSHLPPGPRPEPVGDLRAAHAEDGILRWRWWTPPELARCPEPLWPPQLPALLTPLREGRAGAPPVPVDLGYVPNAPAAD